MLLVSLIFFSSILLDGNLNKIFLYIVYMLIMYYDSDYNYLWKYITDYTVHFNALRILLKNISIILNWLILRALFVIQC